MEMINKAMGVFCGLMLVCTTFAQSDQELIYQAYVTKNMDAWKAVIDRRIQQKNPSADYREKTLNYQYGYVAWSLDDLRSRRKVAEKYLKTAQDELAAYEKEGGRQARIYVYRSAFIAYEMKLFPVKVPFIGLKSVKNGKQAIVADTTDYMSYIQYGNIMHYLPAAFGGSKDKAINYYLKAKRIMDKEKVLSHHNWLYLNLLLTLADVYKKKENYAQVELYYKLVLQIEPQFDWVRYTLYPNLKKMQKS